MMEQHSIINIRKSQKRMKAMGFEIVVYFYDFLSLIM